MYLQHGGYSYHQQLPISVYGDNLVALSQNIIIIFLFWTYSKDISIIEKLFLSGFFSIYAFTLFNDTIIPEDKWLLIMQSNTIFLGFSRVPQILMNFRNKSTGNLAFVTFLLAVSGVAARLVTLLIETDDKIIIF